MLKEYFLSGLRFIRHNKLFASINALGLSIALAVSFLILLFVINELTYNQCHKNIKRIFKVLDFYTDFKITDSGTPYPLASSLKEEFPQVEKAVNVRRIRGFKVKTKNEYIDIRETVATESEILDIFTLPLLRSSDKDHLLDDLNSIVLSSEISDKLFPGTDPVGKEVYGEIYNTEHVFKVTGVFKDLPRNSSLNAKCFLNGKWTLDDINKTFKINNADKDFTKNFWITWILLSKDCKPMDLEKQFAAFEKKHLGEKPANQYSLQNLDDVYLGSADVGNSGMTGNISNVRMFSGIAFLIILVATLNYLILSTALSVKRGTEIGIRKTFGARNRSIKYQLSGESVLLALIVLPFALCLMRISMPFAGKLFETDIKIINSNIPSYILIYLVLTIIIGIVSGLYSSFYLSRLKVMDILKNSNQTGKGKHFFRSSLIVIQLIIFCSFVSASLIVRSQYKYALNKDPGYYNKDILVFEPREDFHGHSAFINAIKANPNVIMAAGVMEGLPEQGSMTTLYSHFQDKSAQVKVQGLAVGYDYLKTMGIKVLQGRDFSTEFGSDLTKSVILNQEAVRQLGIDEPLGKLLGDRTIIGIVGNFNVHSIHTEIPALEISMTDEYINQVAIHYRPGTLNSILPFIEAEWKKEAPDKPFRYFTIEELIKEIYSSERNLSTIVTIFTLFTLIIAAFGLFGLTLFIARSRTREIGIRKVLGASETSIILSFLSDNLILVLISALLSVPVTLYFMIKWLNNFAFRTEINWLYFLIAFAFASAVVLLTVFIHARRASRINPSEALRNE